MPSNIPSKSDENGAAEFIKYQKLCDLDYYSRFSREELLSAVHQSRLCLLHIKKYEHRRDHNSSHTYRSPSAARSIHRIFRF